MSWNHRIIRRRREKTGEEYLAIHEVYYDKKGKPNGYTKNSIDVCCDNLDEIRWTLIKMIECCDRPILDELDFVTPVACRVKEKRLRG